MKVFRAMSCAVLTASSLAMIGQRPATTSHESQVKTPSSQVSPSPTTPSTSAPLQTDGNLQAAPANSTTPVAGVPTSAATPAAIDNATYIIGAEDALQITVWREPTLSGTLPVRPDGKISMVLLGDLPAAGMTPTQLSSDISQRLHKYVQDPSVTVQVMAVNSQRIYMIGEVGHVGPISLSAAMTPLQAIATAGGLSPFANSKHIYILRGAGATQQKIPYNYKQALKGDDRQKIVLRPGDTIVVP